MIDRRGPSGPKRNALPKDVEHWRAFAAQWASLGSPMRPCMEDVGLAEALVAAAAIPATANRAKRAWLLGVTQEIAAAPWLEGFELFAAERVLGMVDAVWPGNTRRRQAICADWRRAPFPDESFDLVIGDGSLSVVDFPHGLSQTLSEVKRCLRPDGHLLLRLFCRPDATETPDEVIAELLAGTIGSIHVFKWRLGMAIQGIDDAPELSVDAVWQVWNRVREDAEKVAEARGWSPAAVRTLELYRSSPARLNFMTFSAIVRVLEGAGFELLATRCGAYELAERCPHVLLRRRQGACGAASA